MDNSGTLHIRCGSDIEPTLREAGFEGSFLDFSDPFCQGPVLDLPPEGFMVKRQSFISDAYGIPETEVMKQQRLRYARLANACAHDHIVLWFEHDSFDQLILAYLLKHFGSLEQRPIIELICIDDYPVEPRFFGLGQLGPDALKGLWGKREVASDDHYRLGAEVWAALIEATPHNLVRIIQRGTPELPMCAPALKRHLQELPARSSGLSLTEELSLKILETNGVITAAKLYSILMREHEPLPYLGDLMYWYDLGRLIAGGAVSQEGADIHERTVTLTDIGRACLGGDADWMAYVAEERYVGGIRIAPDGSKIWRRQG